MAANIFEKQYQQYYTTYIIQCVFLIIAIVFNGFIMIIISVNIFVDCLISVPMLKAFKQARLPPQTQNIVQGS